MSSPHPAPKQENFWLNLLLNIALPALLLMRGDDLFGWVGGKLGYSPEALEAARPLGLSVSALVLVVALAFPVLYFVYDLLRRSKVNFFSIIGFVSVLLTGGIGLLQLPPQYLAIKEAAIPGIIGLVVLVTAFTKKPLVRALLMNEAVVNKPKIERALAESGNETAFARLLKTITYLVAASFFLSSLLNYLLARWIVTTDPAVDAAQFNDELGRMTGLSWPVIVLPTSVITLFALWRLFSGLHRLTGLEVEEMLQPKPTSNPPRGQN